MLVYAEYLKLLRKNIIVQFAFKLDSNFELDSSVSFCLSVDIFQFFLLAFSVSFFIYFLVLLLLTVFFVFSFAIFFCCISMFGTFSGATLNIVHVFKLLLAQFSCSFFHFHFYFFSLSLSLSRSHSRYFTVSLMLFNPKVFYVFVVEIIYKLLEIFVQDAWSAFVVVVDLVSYACCVQCTIDARAKNQQNELFGYAHVQVHFQVFFPISYLLLLLFYIIFFLLLIHIFFPTFSFIALFSVVYFCFFLFDFCTKWKCFLEWYRLPFRDVTKSIFN